MARTKGSPDAGRPTDPGRLLQILIAEHASLTATRGQGQAESSSRAGTFIAALSGGMVAISFIAQATQFGPESIAFALLILPVILFIGLTTFVRTLDIDADDVRWVAALNRVRSGYIELEPVARPYFSTHREDDVAGIMAALTPGRPPSALYGAVSTPGVVAVTDSIVAGAIAGIIATAVAPSIGLPLVLLIGAAAFGLVFALQVAYGVRVFGRAFRDISHAPASPVS